MPILPRDVEEGVRTRSQRQQEMEQGRSGDLPLQPSDEQQPTGPEEVVEQVGASVSAVTDLSALMALLQDQASRQEEQARRQEEHMLLIKDLHATLDKELRVTREQFQEHEARIVEAEPQIADVKKALVEMKAGNGIVTPAVATSSSRGFKVPPFDGTSSWSAYRIQFEAVMKANGWDKEQAMTALTVGLRDQALTVLEALGQDVTYEQLLEALESRYGDAHLEYVYRAQLKKSLSTWC